MIDEFKVRNFLSFKDEQVLSFEPTSDSHYENKYCIEVANGVKLLKTAFIYGANGSGKSNLLIALSFLKDILTNAPKDKNEKIPLAPFMLDNDSKSLNTSFYLSFYLNRKKFIYEIELNTNVIVKESLLCYSSIRPTKLYNRTYDSKAELSIIEFGRNVGISKKEIMIMEGNTLNNTTVLATLTKVNISTTILNEVLEYFRTNIRGLLDPDIDLKKFAIREMESNEQTKEFVLELLEKTGFNISNLEIKKEDIEVTPEMRKMIESAPLSDEDKKKLLDKGKLEHTELVFVHKTSSGAHSLDSGFQSKGTLRYLGMIVLLHKLVNDNSVMPVDEIESGLHYALLKRFLELYLDLGNNESQLIFTTHDINILNEDFIRRDTIWFADKNTDGETTLERLSSKGIHKNISVYNAYKQGKIGGFPNVKN